MEKQELKFLVKNLLSVDGMKQILVTFERFGAKYL